MFYAILSLGLVGAAMVALLPRFSVATPLQRQALWLSFGSVGAAVAFLGFLSTIYDYHNCTYPSRAFPYFVSGRLILGTLIPFLLLYLYGLDRLLSHFQNRWIRPSLLAGMILIMLVSEIVTDWPVFFSEYNWFHM